MAKVIKIEGKKYFFKNPDKMVLVTGSAGVKKALVDFTDVEVGKLVSIKYGELLEGKDAEDAVEAYNASKHEEKSDKESSNLENSAATKELTARIDALENANKEKDKTIVALTQKVDQLSKAPVTAPSKEEKGK